MITSFKAHDNKINRIKSLPNGYVATCSSDFKAKIWDPNNNWKLIRIYTEHKSIVRSLEYINSDTIATGALASIHIWSINGTRSAFFIQLRNNVFTLQLLSNGYHLASGLGNSKINIYDIKDQTLVSVLIGHLSSVFDLVMINSELMASSSSDRTIRIWDLTKNETKFILNSHTNYVYGLKLISTDILVSGSSDRTIKLWNITNGTLIRTLTSHTNSILYSVDVLNYNDRILVSSSEDQSIKLWNTSTGELLMSKNVNTPIRAMAILNTTTLITTESGKKINNGYFNLKS